MNIKKALASVLTLALLAGCTGGNSTASNTTASTNDNGRKQPAETGSKDIDTLKFQFVPSRPVDEIKATTEGLDQLVIEAMKKRDTTLRILKSLSVILMKPLARLYPLVQ